VITDIAVQFATVFLGAYLAFAAEELRQRRQTREWAKTHLRQLSALFSGETQTSHEATDLLDEQLVALDAWLGGRTTEDVSETQWQAIVNVVSARGPDLSSLLRGEPVALLPADLALALSTVEGAGRALETQYESIRAMRERIIVPWAERSVPLSEADRRIVALYRSAVVDYRTLIEQAVAAVRSAVEHIDSWAGAPR
jgi:hypothetical protein